MPPINLKNSFFEHEEGKPHARITLIGKTGKRTVPILNSVKPLENWLGLHPEKENPNAYLFPSFCVDNIRHKLNFNCAKQISNVYFNQKIKKIAKDLEITKNVRPHLFRHLKAVECKKNYVPEPIANELLGWAKGSNMYSHYGAGNEEAQLNAVYKLSGVERQEQKEDIENYKVCENCKTINSADRLYCQTCSSELGYTKPKTEIPVLMAMNKRLDELEKLNQYAFKLADDQIKKLTNNEYCQLVTAIEHKNAKSL